MRHPRRRLLALAAYEAEHAAVFRGPGFAEVHCPFCPGYSQQNGRVYSDAAMRNVLRRHLLDEHRVNLLRGGVE